jgi:hypothetical protein
LDAQEHLNEVRNRWDQSEEGRALARAFTAGFAFDSRVAFPELPQERLEAWCRDEYGQDAATMTEAIGAAHSFYRSGLDRVDHENIVVFVIN